MLVPFPFVFICALLFQRCASDVSESSMTSQSYAIDGTYIYLDTSTATHSDLAKCPQNISIEASALMYESPTSFSMNLNGLKITTANCTYGTEEKTILAGLTNHTVSFGRTEPMKYYTIWNMTLPENSLTCTSQEPSEPFYGGKFSFLPVRALQESLDTPDDQLLAKEEMTGKVDYLLLLSNESMDEMCTFFPATQYNEIKKFIEERYQEHKEFDDMSIGRGKSLNFCTICTCGETLGTDLDLNVIEMKEDDSPEMTPAAEDGEDEKEHWRPPEVRIKNRKCPVAYSNRFEDVVNEETEDDTGEETEDDKTEADMASEESKDAFKETKRLVLYAVVNKLYDEISDELGDEFKDSGFDMRRTAVSLMTSFHRRRVMFMKKGAKCGSDKAKPINKDTVFLYERKHILRQLHHQKFVRMNLERVEKILGTEEEGDEAFTLHVLQKNTDGRFSACAMSNSKEACLLLNQKSFCESFKPLGSMSRATSDEMDKGSKDGQPQTGNPPGGRPAGEDNSGAGSEDGPNSVGPPTTGRPPTNGGTSTSGESGGTPAVGAGNDGSSNPPGGAGPGQTTGTPEATNTPDGTQGTQSPSVSPTPVNPSPTPTPQTASGSNNALCFPGVAKVELEDGGMARMEELQVGDSVRDGSGGFSRVILFTHSAREVISEFVQIETALGDIVLSARHYLPVSGRLMTAESAKVSDRVAVLRNGNKTEAMITKIERVWMRGLFNPQTTSGSIAVWMNGDGVIASAYTAAVEPNVGHALLAPLRMLSYMMDRVVAWSWVFENGAHQFATMMPSGSSVV